MTLPRTTFLLPLLTLDLLTAIACQGGGRSAGTPPESIVGDWILTQMAGDDGAGKGPEDTRPTLTVEGDGRVSGFSGVNRYTASLSVEDLAQGRFLLGPVATTRMAGPPEAMDLESRFLKTLGRVDTYGVRGDVLVLEDSREELLHFLKTSR